MKVARLLAQVRSMRQETAQALTQVTDDSIRWDKGTELQRLTTLKLLLMADRIEELEKELTKLRLEKRYGKGA
jgi:hypothetical protein